MSDYDSGIWTLQEIRDNIIEGSWKDYVPKGDLANVFTAGANNCAQLGQNNSINYSSPTQLPGTQWKKLSATSGLKCDNTLWMWGCTLAGRTGLNESPGVIYSSPIQIPGTTWCSICSDSMGAVALKNDGTLWSWGSSDYGVLGINTTTISVGSKSPSFCNASSPVQIPGTSWCFASKSGNNAAAIKTNGTLWMWGYNQEGQLGQNDIIHRSSPVQVPGTQWCCIEFSTNNCAVFALKKDGTLWSWGNAITGQLGHLVIAHRSSPTQIPGTTWNGVVSSSATTLATKNDGTLWSWGNVATHLFPYFAAIACCFSQPIQAPGTNWTNNIVAMPHAAAALKTDGTMWVWGCNVNGESGANVRSIAFPPISVGGTSWSELHRGENNIWMKQRIDCYNPACEPLTNYEGCGQLWVWGTSCLGGFGLGNDIGPIVSGESTCNEAQSCVAPLPIKGPTGIWKCISSASSNNPSGSTAAGIKNDNTLWIWGRNNNRGLLGLNDFNHRSLPEQIPGTQWCSVSIGNSSALAIKTDNTLWAWGDNSFGFLGLNSTVHRSSPVQIPGTQWCFARISSETAHAAAIKTDGTLWTWGFTDNGQLGDNARIHRSSPVQVPGTQWCKVCTATTVTLALKTDGTLWGWGINDNHGRLGLNDTISRSSPTQIPGTQWCDVSTSCGNALGLKTDGTLWVWGCNSRGALGLNSTAHRSSPTQIPGTQWCAIKVGESHALAIKCDGTLFSWGTNYYIDSGSITRNGGRLGNVEKLGTAGVLNRSSPVQIPGTQWKQFASGDNTIFADPTAIFALKGTTPF